MPVNRCVSRRGIEMGGFDQADFAPFCKALRGDVFPGFSAVARELDQSVIGADPDFTRAQSRRSNGVDDAALRLALRSRPHSQIRTILLPARAAIGCFEKILRAV